MPRLAGEAHRLCPPGATHRSHEYDPATPTSGPAAAAAASDAEIQPPKTGRQRPPDRRRRQRRETSPRLPPGTPVRPSTAATVTTAAARQWRPVSCLAMTSQAPVVTDTAAAQLVAASTGSLANRRRRRQPASIEGVPGERPVHRRPDTPCTARGGSVTGPTARRLDTRQGGGLTSDQGKGAAGLQAIVARRSSQDIQKLNNMEMRHQRQFPFAITFRKQ